MRRHIALKRRLTFNGSHGVISHKIQLFVTTAVRTSSASCILYNYFHITGRPCHCEVYPIHSFQSSNTVLSSGMYSRVVWHVTEAFIASIFNVENLTSKARRRKPPHFCVLLLGRLCAFQSWHGNSRREKKILPGIKPGLFSRPDHSLSLYQSSYSGSQELHIHCYEICWKSNNW